MAKTKKYSGTNQLIANFMGLENKDKICSKAIGEPMYLIDGTVTNLKYHFSWDWLIPVVDKIRNIPNRTFDLTIEIGGHTTLRTRPIESSNRGYDVLECEETKGIETVYKTVCTFIRWSKKNK